MNSQSVVIWITGASQGIGRALALAQASEGHQVVASARTQIALDELARESESLAGNIYPLKLDVTDSDAVSQCVEHIVDKFEGIDQAVLNAGTFVPMAALQFRADVVRQHLDLNVMGVCNCLEPLIIQMRKQSEGLIAINASLSGYRGLPKASAYGASKAALINMSESLHSELKGTGIDIRLINPGFVKTPLTDKNTFKMPFLISSEQAVECIIQGLRSSKFEIRFPTLFGGVMGLLRCLPYRAYFFLIRKLLK